MTPEHTPRAVAPNTTMAAVEEAGTDAAPASVSALTEEQEQHKATKSEFDQEFGPPAKKRKPQTKAK